MKRISVLLFLVAMTGVLIAQLASLPWLNTLLKPLIMASLLFYYLYASPPAEHSRAVMLAILFSFAGDILLLRDKYFLVGLLAFLLAHLGYIVAYRQHRSEETADALHGIQRIRMAFPIILAGTGLVVILYPHLGDFRMPTIAYAVVITLMVLQALFRFGRTSPTSFWMVFGGAILFMISDAMIAIGKFIGPFDYAGFFVMLTYGAAQCLIVEGLVRHPHNDGR